MCKREAQNQLKETRDFKHKHKERLCYCCDTLQESEDKLHKLSICNEDRRYGSIFEEINIEIQLCDKCYKKQYEEWFDEQPIIDDYFENYKYEKDIEKLINSFPIENQEYVWNHTYEEDSMERQDWIDMKLGILPDYKYKEYNMNSPSEIKDYKEKFPTCQHPINIIYKDNTKGCWCPYGAYGEEGQKASVNISNKCCNCIFYEKRETPIDEMTDENFQIYKNIVKGELSKLTIKKINK